MMWRAFVAALAMAAALAAAGAEGQHPPITFYKNIAPILITNCAPCHRPGESGPFPLLTYQDAKKHALQIAAVTRSHYMPPWLPEAGYGDFADERRLTDAQIHTIGQWASAGAPEGSVSDTPGVPVFTPGWQLGPPDLIVQPAKPFTVPASGPDVFWNFILSPTIGSTRYVKAIEIRPGKARIVHHANLLIDRARSARRQEVRAGGGFPGMDLTIESDTFDPDSHFLFWKPGSVPPVEPEGLAWRLDPGNDLVLNVHLQPSGRPEAIQPSVGLYFTDKPPTKYPMLIQLEHDGALDIPPGDKDFLISDDFRLPLDVDVLAVYPHAHYLGKLLEGFATLPEGTRKPLIRIPDWDLNWQAVYRYRTPVFLPKGTVVSMRFHYDNSDANPRNPNRPPKRVVGGNQATDEMGHLWLQVLPRGTGDRRMILQEAIMRHRLDKYPADFAAHFNLGALMLRRNDVAAAIDYLRDALRAEPDQPIALNTLGAALESSGKLDEAIAQFRHALRVQPDYVNARYNIANTLADEGKLDEAAANFREILAASPGDQGAREHLIKALTELGDSNGSEGHLAAATGYYRELVALQPRDANFHNNYGTLLARSGDLAAATAQFKEALKIDPSNAAARRNLDLAIKSR